MRVLFDTTVLVAGLVAAHPFHAVCFSWLRRAHRREVTGLVSTHALAEMYGVLTAMPHRPRISPADAHQLIRTSVLARFQTVPLTTRDYASVLRGLAEAGLSGGVFYDALATRAAAKAHADQLLTLNRRDFERLAHLFAVTVTEP